MSDVNLKENLKRDLSQAAREAQAAVMRTAHSTAERLGCTPQQLQGHCQSIADASYNTVIRRPGLTLLLVAGASFAVGYLLGSPRRPQPQQS
ncbi:hypothetical protein [Chitinimonas lacunae]|uniref:DUF3618 domain-containing protein n=1 Tax=Chitinimonas lacunae TaxID=1963018 RepID=A0ABV8MMU3_9NEIS